MVQRRGDNGNPEDYFYRNWTEYKFGFGDLTQVIFKQRVSLNLAMKRRLLKIFLFSSRLLLTKFVTKSIH